MKRWRPTFRELVGWLGFGLVALVLAATLIWRGDIQQAGLDPQIPFQTYEPPPAPDYARADSWLMQDEKIPGAGAAAVFFVHPTTFDGGADWLGPIGDERSDAYLRRVVVPNLVGPFARAGSITLPRYRQASVYTRLTLRDDARDARQFAYRDVLAAFDVWIARHPDRPIILAGAEQGGELMDRLLHERVIANAGLRDRLVGVYLIDAMVPAARFKDLPLCARPEAVDCAVVWAAADQDDQAWVRRKVRRGLTWDSHGQLIGIAGAPMACVNPVSGAVTEPSSPARLSRGATNGTNLEWGARPALVGRSVAAACRNGLLWYSRPEMESFKPSGSWVDRRKTAPYNLFYADIEADALRRLRAWENARP